MSHKQPPTDKLPRTYRSEIFFNNEYYDVRWGVRDDGWLQVISCQVNKNGNWKHTDKYKEPEFLLLLNRRTTQIIQSLK